MNTDGSGRQQITTSGYKYAPAWSPDGTKIAFSGEGIVVMNADGSGNHQVVSYGRGPSWSPDGTKIAFNGKDTPWPSSVEIAFADGHGSPTLTIPNGRDLAWSADGTKIAYVNANSRQGDIHVANADLSGDVQITSNDNFKSKPSWSPDGTKLAFS